MAAALLPAAKLSALEAKMEEAAPQYGLLGQMMAQPGKRAELLAILTEGTGQMPGNIAYLIGADSANPDAIWIVELTSEERRVGKESVSTCSSLGSPAHTKKNTTTTPLPPSHTTHTHQNHT